MWKNSLYGIIAFTLLFTGCFNIGSGPVVNYENLFPIEDNSNIWYYSDADSNQMIIQVKDTISDGNTMYVKVAITETKLNLTEEHWFLETYSELQYAPSLSSQFTTLYEKEMHSEGGSYYLDGDRVEYEVYDNYYLKGKYYSDVVELIYDENTLDGFSKILFSDGLGPIELTDERGRWPVTYSLDSAFVDGVQR